MAPKISSALIRSCAAAALMGGFATAAAAGPPEAARVPLVSISDEGAVQVSVEGFLEERLVAAAVAFPYLTPTLLGL